MSNPQSDFLKLLEKTQKDRDLHWEQELLKVFPQINVTLLHKNPQPGPDHFPYMYAEIKEDSSEPALNILNWMSQNGVGLAINPQKNYPDYVFTYGMIWNYFKSGQFLENPIAQHVHGSHCNHGHEHDKNNEVETSTFYVGSPSESYLPKNVRSTIREFLKHQGIMAPKVSMISPDQVNFDLCFSIESFGSPDSKEHEGILQAVSWFLPAHYSLAFVSEKHIPSFEEL